MDRGAWWATVHGVAESGMTATKPRTTCGGLDVGKAETFKRSRKTGTWLRLNSHSEHLRAKHFKMTTQQTNKHTLKKETLKCRPP